MNIAELQNGNKIETPHYSHLKLMMIPSGKC